LRIDPIIGRWVIISPGRGLRPHDFKHREEAAAGGDCPFCEGNEGKTPPEVYAIRDGTPPNSPGWKVRVVTNKYSALSSEEKLEKWERGIFRGMAGMGAHEVIIETPEHDKRLEMHTPESLWPVLDVYRLRLLELSADDRFRYVLLFKNEGEKAGASLSHPHTQIIATPVTPKRIKEELRGSGEYYRTHGECIFCKIIQEEQAQRERIVAENESFLALCPFASRFPYETWILPKKHSPDYYAIDSDGIHRLAQVIIETMKKLSGVLNRPQYNYILHTAPVRYAREGYWTTLDADWHWHIEIISRVTEIGGFEWGTGLYINTVSPEDAAESLREAEGSI